MAARPAAVARSHPVFLAAVLTLCQLGKPDAASAFGPSGSQFQVNTYTTGKQDYPAVASNSTGTNFVVAWRSDGSPGDDASGTSIQGQRYLPEPSFVPSVGAMLAMLV